MFNWTLGRQSTGYKKLKLFQFLNMDCYILKYVEGDYIPVHTDPVPGRKHWRVNLVLWQATRGGVFQYRSARTDRWVTPDRLAVFRSDICPHHVTKIEYGSRYVLTFGIAI